MDGIGASDTDGAGQAAEPATRAGSRSRSGIGRVVRWVGRALAIWLVVQMVVTAVLAAEIAIHPGSTLWQDCQPESVTYDDASYCVGIYQRRARRWWVVPLADDQHEIWVGRGPQPSYGHVVEHEFSGDVDLLVAEWTSDGLALVEPSGHRVFIPAASFTGGR